MDKLIEQVLVEQNPHWGGERYNHVYSRLHDRAVKADLKLDEIQIITGIRRCGKSTLLQTLINELSQSVDAKAVLYINFDDPNYTEVSSDAANIYSIITTAEKITGVKIEFLFLDEIQNVLAWERYVKSVYDSRRFRKVVVTGSNGDLLNSDYATLLSGRYIETRIYPLSFKELLINHGINDTLQLTRNKSSVLRIVDQMLRFGGFPRILLIKNEDERVRILKGYYETILLKDCIQNHGVRDTRTFTNLTHYIINNTTSTYSYNSLSKAIDSNENTAQNFIQILSNAYFIEEIRQFSYSMKSQSRRKKKPYCIDNGLINAVTFKFSHDYGKLFENLVYSELKKTSPGEIAFFNTNKECDFIIHSQSSLIAMQACYELTPNNRQREINGLIAAMDQFSIPKGIILTMDQQEQIDQRIVVMPFWKYFS